MESLRKSFSDVNTPAKGSLRARLAATAGPSRVTRRGDRVLEAIATLGHSTGSDRHLGEYLQRVAAATCDALEYSVCVVYLYDQSDDTFYAESTHGLSVDEQNALFAKPVPRRVLDRLMVETYRLNWSYYVPANTPPWQDAEVAACFRLSTTPPPTWQPGWQPGDLFLMPLEINGKDPIGFLILDAPIDGRLPDPETQLGIATLAKSCANAVESAHLYKMQSEEAAISSALLKVAEAVGTPNQNLLFTRASSILAELLSADHCAIWHIDEGNVAMHLIVDGLNWTSTAPDPLSMWEGKDGLQELLGRGEPVIVESGGRKNTNKLISRLGLSSALLIPLFLHDTLVGAIATGWTGSPHRFRSRDLDIARGVSRLVGVALENAQLYRDTRLQAERNAQLYEREREAVQRLQELDQLRNDFVSTVSHELRTPLTGIKGFTDTLLSYWERMDDTRRLDMVHRISSSSSRLERLVHDLLFVSRVESGVLPLRRSAVELRPLIDGAIQEVESKYRGQHIEVCATPTPVTVVADPDRVQQVIVNLLDNAAKYSLEGRPIRVRFGYKNNSVYVSVIDCGPGIEQDDFVRLFTRFGKLNRMPRAGHVGTGLGLYISKSLVEAMNGHIFIRSRPNWGSIFTFTLPMAVGEI